MNAKELAQQLTSLTYPVEIPEALAAQAKTSGLVIVYGHSDDLMEFEGAIEGELDCYAGGTAQIDAKGLLPSFEAFEAVDKDALRRYYEREKHAVSIEALWRGRPGHSWTYATALPHETFVVMDDDQVYCRGLVFSMADVARVVAARATIAELPLVKELVRGEPAASQAARDVLAERARQQSVHGCTFEQDDRHTEGSLALAAAAYAVHATASTLPMPNRSHHSMRNVLLSQAAALWPWARAMKDASQRESLVKAAALLLAEIERLDRAVEDSARKA